MTLFKDTYTKALVLIEHLVLDIRHTNRNQSSGYYVYCYYTGKLLHSQIDVNSIGEQFKLISIL